MDFIVSMILKWCLWVNNIDIKIDPVLQINYHFLNYTHEQKYVRWYIRKPIYKYIAEVAKT